MKTTVIYHSADFDGIFCREIARKFLPDAESIGWNFGDEPLQVPDGTLYVMDLPLDAPFGGKSGQFNMGIIMAHEQGKLVWIDHHVSAIKTHAENTVGYRIDGVAACRLAWQWFLLHEAWDPREMHPPSDLPAKSAYVDRTVSEPLAVRLAGEYDIWDKRDSRAETFQYGLRCEGDRQDLSILLADDKHVLEVLNNGQAAQRYAQATDASICKAKTWLMEWEGLNFLCINSARFNSLVFAAKDVPETGHDALLGFCFDGKQWTVSLYHANHLTDLDLSEIAKRYGGGGHRGACGFTCKTIPFDL